MSDDKWLELPEPAPHGCSCCYPTSDSPDPVVVRLERENEELRAESEGRLNELVRVVKEVENLTARLAEAEALLSEAADIIRSADELTGEDRDFLRAVKEALNHKAKKAGGGQ